MHRLNLLIHNIQGQKNTNKRETYFYCVASLQEGSLKKTTDSSVCFSSAHHQDDRKDVHLLWQPYTHTDKTHFLIIFIHSYFLSLSHIYTCTQTTDNTDALLPLWLCHALHSCQHLKHKNNTQFYTERYNTAISSQPQKHLKLCLLSFQERRWCQSRVCAISTEPESAG